MADTGTAGGGHAIVIEGDAATQDLIEKVLRRLKIDMEIAKNGPDALVRVGKRPPCVLIINLLMAGMDGVAFLRAIRSRNSTRDIPIVVATERDDPRTMIEATSLGVNAFLSRPYTPQELMSRVRRSVGAP